MVHHNKGQYLHIMFCKQSHRALLRALSSIPYFCWTLNTLIITEIRFIENWETLYHAYLQLHGHTALFRKHDMLILYPCCGEAIFEINLRNNYYANIIIFNFLLTWFCIKWKVMILMKSAFKILKLFIYLYPFKGRGED